MPPNPKCAPRAAARARLEGAALSFIKSRITNGKLVNDDTAPMTLTEITHAVLAVSLTDFATLKHRLGMKAGSARP